MGGIKENNIILVEGSSGSGKTTFGLEYIYRGAKDFKENGLIISFELSPQKLLRDARGFGWDFETLQRKNKVKIIYTSPLVILQELQSPDGVLINEIRALNAKRILLMDSPL
jgi:circadian clock protein KaiC